MSALADDDAPPGLRVAFVYTVDRATDPPSYIVRRCHVGDPSPTPARIEWHPARMWRMRNLCTLAGERALRTLRRDDNLGEPSVALLREVAEAVALYFDGICAGLGPIDCATWDKLDLASDEQIVVRYAKALHDTVRRVLVYGTWAASTDSMSNGDAS